ncbi:MULTISPECIES: MgtC/SapB family protein [Paraclostridium]|jgi:putative Mg2+ transporter-C (MgtC) family protein|uniref:MgtC family protein n=4 Tax=Bacillota TaxID=1239 RepID=T4VLA7_PARBF|nr:MULTISPECIES: MgtC/SapB family protein [Paraclostridium]MCU9807137.1 MgtC/SapB family protein [Paraclostridium sp. AKS46]MDV8110265.1 MgtC/SapB family protein [Bacillus sp. BAU-SS-2023]EQK41910.1 mgtC family protein [[Clostridium] bifermentans ATCC 638] [Paraclostridium bifermentans ATCC 638 = DSM 14991]EQK45352.1 mgtC family protein [[Clostridium] bifermentans ATCC 19299] [Paraclostridium bifermentans ATCC 19299]MBN8046324.1 MgtC/SapB family protein [Paraclostridium bifermentans]
MKIQDIVIRILLSIFIGGIIGFNRERENVSAGFRTHALVCLGATIAALIQVQLASLALSQITSEPALSGIVKVNDGRFIGQVVSGIGFLGAGTIIKTKGSVKGLTTAASIWTVACIGIATGMGFYEVSILGGISTIIVLVVLKKIEGKYINKSTKIKLIIKYKSKTEAIKELKNSIEDLQLQIESIEFVDEFNVIYTLKDLKLICINDLISLLSENESILKVSKIDNF